MFHTISSEAMTAILYVVTGCKMLVLGHAKAMRSNRKVAERE